MSDNPNSDLEKLEKEVQYWEEKAKKARLQKHLEELKVEVKGEETKHLEQLKAEVGAEETKGEGKPKPKKSSWSTIRTILLAIFIVVIFVVVGGCCLSAVLTNNPQPTSTPYPTNTPYPTSTVSQLATATEAAPSGTASAAGPLDVARAEQIIVNDGFQRNPSHDAACSSSQSGVTVTCQSYSNADGTLGIEVIQMTGGMAEIGFIQNTYVPNTNPFGKVIQDIYGPQVANFVSQDLTKISSSNNTIVDSFNGYEVSVILGANGAESLTIGIFYIGG